MSNQIDFQPQWIFERRDYRAGNIEEHGWTTVYEIYDFVDGVKRFVCIAHNEGDARRIIDAINRRVGHGLQE